MVELHLPSPVQLIEDDLLHHKQVTLYVKRDDLIHPHIQGNKWRKLKYNLQKAQQEKYSALLTFGGPYSNHIYAVAAAARAFNIAAIGIIRGEEPQQKSDTLLFAEQQGMQLHYVDRETYREKEDAAFIAKLREQFGSFYYIPEGGTNQLALRGVGEMMNEVQQEYDVVAVACGTGGTLAGIVAALQGRQQALGFSSLRGEDKLSAVVNNLVMRHSGHSFSNFRISFDYHFGGYAKVTDELLRFIKNFREQFDIPLEPVYTAKMFYGLFDLIRKDQFAPGTRIVAIHTGGLQGLCGYKQYFN